MAMRAPKRITLAEWVADIEQAKNYREPRLSRRLGRLTKVGKADKRKNLMSRVRDESGLMFGDDDMFMKRINERTC